MNSSDGARRDGAEVREGFICPLCMEDQVSSAQLLVHFEDQHGNEDKAVLQAFKGFITKAKKVLMNEDETDSVSSGGVKSRRGGGAGASGGGGDEDSVGGNYQQNNPWKWDPPPPGLSRNHISFFKKIRSARIDSSVAETNKLLIRLDKLLKDLPSDPVKRKAHERNIVMWADDRDVPLCPSCARSFNLARRRHHCRLCGGIMCDSCSQFITFAYAKKLVNEVHKGRTNKIGDGGAGGSGGGVTGMTSRLGIRRSGSQGSLNSLMSVVDSITGEQHFRTCQHCTVRLQVRDSQVEQRSSKPTLAMYYEKMMEYRHQLEELIPQYKRMVQSLQAGETSCTLREAEEFRIMLVKKGDGLMSMAERLRKLYQPPPPQSDDPSAPPPPPPVGPRQEQLMRRIHSTSSTFMKENFLSLPTLPTQKELLKLQERRRVDIEARQAAQKEVQRQAQERAERRREKDNHQDSPGYHTHRRSSSLTPPALSLPKKNTQRRYVVGDTGWIPDISTTDNVTETDDPLIQQINIIRNTIKQAKLAGRSDDVRVLESNLRELQEEYKKQARLMNP